MGFFDDLIDGVTAGANWIGDHSDQIMTVAATVAKIAGAAPSDENDDQDSLNALITNIGKAQTYLQNHARTTAVKYAKKHKHLQVFAEGGGSWNTYSGIWKDVPLPQSNAPVSLGQYKDVAAVLSGFSCPLNDPQNNNADIVNTLALGMFGNAAGSITTDDGCEHSMIGYSSSASGLRIHGCHYYLKLPTHINQSKTPWLAGLYVAVDTSSVPKFSYDYVGLGRIHRPIYRNWAKIDDSTTSYWSITVRMVWASASGLDSVIQLMLAGIANAHSTWTNVYGSIQGVRYVLTLFAPPSDTPSFVRQGVLEQANSAISQSPPIAASINAPIAVQAVISAEVDSDFIA